MPSTPGNAPRRVPLAAVCVAVALALFALRLLLEANVDLGIQDEGFLWYGVLRTREGLVPLVDFRSYDPGRYYWCAALASALGEGVVALRIAVAAFGAIGLALGLLASTRVTRCRWAPLVVGWLLILWMQPRWKLFEPSIAMAAVWAGVRLVERPSLGRHLAAGVLAGLAAFFGRNLGLYTAVSLGALALFVAWKTHVARIGDALRGDSLLARLGALAAGAVLGYAPMIVLALAVPDFAAAFSESVAAQLGRATNLERAAPWPWSIDGTGLARSERVALFLQGCAFLALPLVYVPALIALLRTRRADLERRALLAAATFVGLAFAHHASVRSDVFHLAQCFAPLLLVLLALPRAFGSRPPTPRVFALAAALLALSMAAIGSESALAHRLRVARDDGSGYVRREIAGDELWLATRAAEMVDGARALVVRHVGDAPLFIAPHRPGLYPVLGRVAPTWDTYLSEPAGDAAQDRLLRELADVDWALTHRVPAERGGQLGLAESNPRVWRYIEERFKRLDASEVPHGHFLWRRR